MVLLASCSSAPPPVSVSLAVQPRSSPSFLAPTILTAYVTNDLHNLGVTWTVTCGQTDCGSLSAEQTSSGVSTSYTSLKQQMTVTITATAGADPSKTASTTFAVTGIPTTVTLGPTPSTLAVNAQTTISYGIVSDPAFGIGPERAGVFWTATCGSSQCGSFSLYDSATCPNPSGCGASSVSGNGPVFYTAPSTIPSGGTVTITATAEYTTPYSSSSASITIIPAATTSGP